MKSIEGKYQIYPELRDWRRLESEMKWATAYFVLVVGTLLAMYGSSLPY